MYSNTFTNLKMLILKMISIKYLANIAVTNGIRSSVILRVTNCVLSLQMGYIKSIII